jgi:acyl-ACP thioesterase
MRKGIWQDGYTVRSYEIDAHARATLPVLCRYLQESAWNHAENLKIGFSALLAKNLVWILARQRIDILKYPRWGDTITVETWPSGSDRLYCYRDFRVLDSEQQLLVQAASTWFAVDLSSRRPQKTEKYLNQGIVLNESLYANRVDKISAADHISRVNEIIVGYSDLDVNEHVNNVRYVEWLLDSFDMSFRKKYEVRQLCINYLSEAKCKDTVLVGVAGLQQQTFMHRMIRKADDVDLCRMTTCWQDIT